MAPSTLDTAAGAECPVLHVDSDGPLHDDDGAVVSEGPWGIYVKPDRETVQGGAQPLAAGPRASTSTRTRPAPSSPASPTCGARRSRTAWSGSRAVAEATSRCARAGRAPSRADNFPVFDRMRDNVYVAADSNHGYKMIAVGREIARELRGEHSTLLAALPLRALRHRRAAPGLAQPVPVELERRQGQPHRRRRRRAGAVGGVAARRAGRRRAGAGEGPRSARAPRGPPAGSFATTTARPRSRGSSRRRWTSSRPRPMSSAFARSATSRPCHRARSRTWSRSASSTSAPATSRS